MKSRIIIYSVLLGLLTALTGVGLFNLVVNTRYKNNEVSFKVNNDQTFFEVAGNYYYGEITEPTKTYNAKYIQEDFYNGIDATIEPWDIGASQFIRDDEHPENDKDILTYIINITNKNSERNLNVKLNNVAVHKDAYFITEISYVNDGINKGLMFTNDSQKSDDDGYLNSYNPAVNPNLVSISSDEIVAFNKTLQIKITLKLNTRTKAFTVDNNFSIELESVAI